MITATVYVIKCLAQETSMRVFISLCDLGHLYSNIPDKTHLFHASHALDAAMNEHVVMQFGGIQYAMVSKIIVLLQLFVSQPRSVSVVSGL